MKNMLQFASVMLLMTTLGVDTVQAGPRGRLANLNPFKKDDAISSSTPRKTILSRFRRGSAKRSTSERVGGGSKKFFAKTKDWITPWKSNSRDLRSIRPATGSRSVAQAKNDRWKPLSRFRKDEAAKSSLTTPHDFLARKQPGL